MVKLNPKKIKWILRQKERGELSTAQIAAIQRVTPRRVNQLRQDYRNTGEMPVLMAQSKYKLNACLLEPILKREFGVKMSHNKIHVVLREHRLANREPKKAKRRKWVRYERKHSMSLWHTDWKYLSSLKKWMIA